MIPEEAVLYRATEEVVFLFTDGDRVERRIIETGVHQGGAVEIVRGLEGGEFVVTRGHQDLIDGALVAARNSDGSPATPQVAGGGTPAESSE
jgi:membrane fusion protein (multidrug efflux system)